MLTCHTVVGVPHQVPQRVTRVISKKNRYSSRAKGKKFYLNGPRGAPLDFFPIQYCIFIYYYTVPVPAVPLLSNEWLGANNL